MKKILLLLVLPAIFSCATVPKINSSYKSDVTEVLNGFYAAMEKGDWARVAEYYPEEYFKLYSREDFITGYTSAMNLTQNQKVHFLPPAIVTISELFLQKDKYYCRLDYFVKADWLTDEKNGPKAESEYLFLVLKFGVENVTVNKEQKSIQTKIARSALAIYDSGKRTWNILGINSDDAAAAKIFLPNEVITHFFKN
jgi:hypothetical protein